MTRKISESRVLTLIGAVAQPRDRTQASIDDTDSPHALLVVTDTLYCETTAGDIQVDLPSIANTDAAPTRIVHYSGSGEITLLPDGSDTVDDDIELVIPYVGDVVTLIPDPIFSNWHIV